MYAIIEDSGKQYKVSENDTIEIDLRDLPEGTPKIEFDKVLLVGDESKTGSTQVGQPYLPGAKVIATIGQERKLPKLSAIKFARRKGYYRKLGHRQTVLRVTIDQIKSA